MKKPSYAIAMELRQQDVELNAKFEKLSEKFKWDWLQYATEHTPMQSMSYARELIDRSMG